jgi:hypothetical protein
MLHASLRFPGSAQRLLGQLTNPSVLLHFSERLMTCAGGDHYGGIISTPSTEISSTNIVSGPSQARSRRSEPSV